MFRLLRTLLAASCSLAPIAARAADEPPAPMPVVAVVESSLATEAKQIRQLAFDGDPETYFASSAKPGEADQFTIRLDKPVAVKSIEVTTGRTSGDDALESGSLEISADGQAFEPVAEFAKGGVARISMEDRPVQAIRIKPGPDQAASAGDPRDPSSAPPSRSRGSPTPSSTPSTSAQPPR